MLPTPTDTRGSTVNHNPSARVGTIIGIALMVAAAAVVLSGAAWCVVTIWEGIVT